MSVAGYELKVNGGDLTDEIIDVGNVLEYDVENLEPGEYDVAVRAYDGAGNRSAWSPEVSATLAGPAVEFVAAVSSLPSVSGPAETEAMDTTEADFLIACIADLNGAASVITDTYENTWTAMTPYQAGSGNGRQRFYRCDNPVVGEDHTFVVYAGGDANYASIHVAAFKNISEVDGASVGAGNESTTTQQPGSLTPTEDGCVVVVGFQFVASSGTPSINQSFIIATFSVDSGATGAFSGGIAYRIQTTAAAVNPAVTGPGAADRMAVGQVALRKV